MVGSGLRTVPKGLEKKTGGTKNQRKNRNHIDYSITKIGYNTQKSPGCLRRLTVIQTLNVDVKNSQGEKK